jgi:pullulanase/glycogen debranching enzyme
MGQPFGIWRHVLNAARTRPELYEDRKTAPTNRSFTWRRNPRQPRIKDPLWYKDAVIYQVHVKSYFDSNNDGIGDFPGLIAKLDYIADLGVNTIWLLPFYPSPRRDDGYDIAEYRGVHSDYGTMADAKRFIAEAHKRGLRVITELVINHTSDQHPVVPARTARPRKARRRGTSTSGPMTIKSTTAPASSSRHRKIELDLGPGGRRNTSGTASIPTSRT